MLKVTEMAFVGYPVTDLKRAREFYEGALGLKASSVMGDEKAGWVEYELDCGTLGIGCGMEEWKPSPDGGAAALEVEDFDEAISHLKQHDVPVVFGPIENPGCFMAVILDPDTNALVIHKRKAG